MWNPLTEEDKNTIEKIYNYFSHKFPEIELDILKKRIFSGYCYGEGSSRIMSIEDWENVFYGSGLKKDLLTCFDDWEDYNKYGGDFHNKIKF